ncbi:BDNF/NT-3 growth factors receptor [Galendromus occidentalis]|uniref:BDNF/NT-3 growth factors receptor n=1 Tax=Galendromus occidentalis TaxID=34638 RepID=A0AAJ7PB34_9ACAR|nr:BDNF/NT-3 growth factors receptor [Galendromus occidentalis]
MIARYVTNPAYYPTHLDFKGVPIEIEIGPDNVTFLEVIGEGCFGKVHRALYTNREGVSLNVAVKMLKDVASPEAMADFEREVLIMANFSHPNILKLIGVVYKETDSVPWMVFEFMQYGDLAELLRANAYKRTQNDTGEGEDVPFMKISQEDLPNIAMQIASGMLYLSTQHFVHRDLATRNCLVGEGLSVKISDFGMSRDVYTCDYYKIGGSRMLPVRWMAPESIMYGKFTLESDIWSYGIVLWETFTFGKQPYYGHTNEEVVKLILHGILLTAPENTPAHIREIMVRCWKSDPRDRLRFAGICEILEEGSLATSTKMKSDDLSLDMDDYLLPVCDTSEL